MTADGDFVREALAESKRLGARQSRKLMLATQAGEEALSRLEARIVEADIERERFHRHVEEMIEPKLLARAEAAKARCERLEKALRESDSLIRLLRPDLSHTRSQADRIVEANRVALAEEPHADVAGAGQRGCG